MESDPYTENDSNHLSKNLNNCMMPNPKKKESESQFKVKHGGEMPRQISDFNPESGRVQQQQNVAG